MVSEDKGDQNLVRSMICNAGPLAQDIREKMFFLLNATLLKNSSQRIKRRYKYEY
jgi:hypothetical protein